MTRSRGVPVGAHVRAAAHDTRAGDEICCPDALTAAEARGARLARPRRGRGAPAPAWSRSSRPATSSSGRASRSGRGQIHDANGVALAAAVVEAGGEPLRPAARAATTRRRSSGAARGGGGRADLVVTSGGVERRPARLRARRARAARQPRLLAHRRPARQAAGGRGAGWGDRHRPAGQPGQRARHLRALRAAVHPRHARPAGDGRLHVRRRADGADREGRRRGARSCASSVWQRGRRGPRPPGRRPAVVAAAPDGGCQRPARRARGARRRRAGRSYEAIVLEPLTGR